MLINISNVYIIIFVHNKTQMSIATIDCIVNHTEFIWNREWRCWQIRNIEIRWLSPCITYNIQLPISLPKPLVDANIPWLNDVILNEHFCETPLSSEYYHEWKPFKVSGAYFILYSWLWTKTSYLDWWLMEKILLAYYYQTWSPPLVCLLFLHNQVIC